MVQGSSNVQTTQYQGKSALYLPERWRGERTDWVPFLRQDEVRGGQMVSKVDVLGGDAQPGGGEGLLLLHQGGALGRARQGILKIATWSGASLIVKKCHLP